MRTRSPWYWVPSLYFAEGLPYVAVMILSLVMYKRMGISNTEVALYTSWLNLPWVIKPLWSPFIDLLRTKRWWIVTTQLLLGAGLAGIAFTIPTSHFFQITLAVFWLVAFSSATHDIAADGFYMLGLTPHQQAFFVGIRSTFYRFATIAGQGLLIMLAGWLEEMTGRTSYAWSITFFTLAGCLLALWLYHSFVLPRPDQDCPSVARQGEARSILTDFLLTFRSFFQKEQALTAILFMLLYRLPEAQLAKMVSLPARPSGTRRTRHDHGTDWLCPRNARHCRSHLRRHLRRHCRSTPRTAPLALADGVGHLPARHCLCVPELRPARQLNHREQLHLCGTVRLRIRIHGLHALPYLFCQRHTQDLTLCHLYRLHGLGHDAAGHDSRLDARNPRLPAVLHLDYGLHSGHLRRYRPVEN